MIKKVSWLGIFCSVFFASSLFAHPHVFIDNTITIVFDQNGLVGIKVKWVFDEMFSSMLIHDYDKNGDGVFGPDEIEKIKNGAFSNLKNFHYFTYIKINGEKFKVEYVKNFSSYLDSKRIVYNFFVPCHVSATSLFKEIKLSVYDNTYYTDIMLSNQNPVNFENASLFEYTYKILDNTKEAFYFGQVFPQEIFLKFRKKE